MEKLYITTATDQVVGYPNIDFVAKILQADVLARYYEKDNKDTYFLIGVNDYVCNRFVKESFINDAVFHYRVLIERLNIANTFFIRATDEDLHLGGVQKMWERLIKNGDIYKGKKRGVFCKECGVFAEKEENFKQYFPDCRGKLIFTEKQGYFLKTSKYRKKIKKTIEKGDFSIYPQEYKEKILNILSKEIEDFLISHHEKECYCGLSVEKNGRNLMGSWFHNLSIPATGIGFKDERREYVKNWPTDIHFAESKYYYFYSVLWLTIFISAKIDRPKKVYFYDNTVEAEGDIFNFVKGYDETLVRYYLLKNILNSKKKIFFSREAVESAKEDRFFYLMRKLKKNKVKRSSSPLEDDFLYGKMEEEKQKQKKLMENFLIKDVFISIEKFIEFFVDYSEKEGINYEADFIQEMISPFLPKLAKEMNEKDEKLF